MGQSSSTRSPTEQALSTGPLAPRPIQSRSNETSKSEGSYVTDRSSHTNGRSPSRTSRIKTALAPPWVNRKRSTSTATAVSIEEEAVGEDEVVMADSEHPAIDLTLKQPGDSDTDGDSQVLEHSTSDYEATPLATNEWDDVNQDTSAMSEPSVTSPTEEPTVPQSTPARRIVVQGTISSLPAPPRNSVTHPSASSSAAPSPPSATTTTTNSNPTSDEATSESRSIDSPATAVAVTSSLSDQAALIGRLLSVAAAATAASLLPGRISINGQAITGFPGIESGGPGSYSALATGGERQASGPWRERLMSDRNVWVPAEPTSSTAATATSETPSTRVVAEAPSSPLQDILRQALHSDEEIESNPASTDPSPSESNFETFLSELQSEVTTAVLSSSTALPSLSVPRRPFTFFRMHRFRNRTLDSNGALIDRSTSDYVAGGPVGVPVDDEEGDRSSHMDVDEDVDEQAGSAETSQNVVVTPVLLVGVRSIEPGEVWAGLGPVSTPQPTPPPAVEPLLSSVPALEALPLSDAETDSLPDLEAVDSEDEEDETVSFPPPPPPLPPPQTSTTAGGRSFIIWIAGGIYPPNHQILTMPAILSGFESEAGYEELLRLAELLGQHKPPTATSNEIAKSGLRVVRGSDLVQLLAASEVRSNTAERCLVCLEDYGEDDEVRIMSCRHAFHKDCVDHWLSIGANSCPACRAQGVEKEIPNSTS